MGNMGNVFHICFIWTSSKTQVPSKLWCWWFCFFFSKLFPQQIALKIGSSDFLEQIAPSNWVISFLAEINSLRYPPVLISSALWQGQKKRTKHICVFLCFTSSPLIVLSFDLSFFFSSEVVFFAISLKNVFSKSKY